VGGLQPVVVSSKTDSSEFFEFLGSTARRMELHTNRTGDAEHSRRILWSSTQTDRHTDTDILGWFWEKWK
jgi:hypothetical protein